MPTLYLIPTSLNPKDGKPALLEPDLRLIQNLTHFVVETPKVGRSHLKALDLNTPLQKLIILELNKHKNDYSELIKPLKAGYDLGLISDCGAPCVADPGSRLVGICHELDFKIKPLIGPSSILLSLMASGLNGQRFSFIGYLPNQKEALTKNLKELENQALRESISFIFIEAPFRNQNLFDQLLKTLSPEIKLSLSINLMLENELIMTKTIKEWQKFNLTFDLNNQEIIFLLGV